MSLNGESLSDWQWVVNGINERIHAVSGNASFSSPDELSFIPVPVQKSHISKNLVSLCVERLKQITTHKGYGNWNFIDKNNPVVIAEPGSQYWPAQTDTYTGRYVAHHRGLTGNIEGPAYPQSFIQESVHGFCAIPMSGTQLKNTGWFLDCLKEVLGMMMKTSVYTIKSSGKHAWYSCKTSTGEVYDYITQETVQGVSITNYQELYAYAISHFVDDSVPNDGRVYIKQYQRDVGEEIEVRVYYNEIKIAPNGGLVSDITAYISTEGDNLGIQVTNYDYVEGEQIKHHIDYITRTFNNVSIVSPANIGLTSSDFSTPPALPPIGEEYRKVENIVRVMAVCDYAQHFNYI